MNKLIRLKLHQQLFLLFIFLSFTAKPQGGLQISPGCYLKVVGNPVIVINGNFTNNGTFVKGTGKVTFAGSTATNNTKIGGTGPLNFYDLEIRKSANDVLLNKNINIEHFFNFNLGNLILNNFTVDLGTTGGLFNENELSHITELNFVSPGGKVMATYNNMLNPDSVNPGNLGLYITDVQHDLGNVMVMRGHIQQLASPLDGINRFYEIIPSRNSGLDVTLTFTYLDADDAGHYESIYQQYATASAVAAWLPSGLTLRSTALNFVEMNGYNTLSKVTLAHADLQLYTGQIVSTICAGNPVSVPFTTGLAHDTTNIFSAELSDDKGSFGSPLVIGTLKGTSSGTINALIPLATIGGTKYRIRVTATTPSVTGNIVLGANNGVDITINESHLYYMDADNDGFGNSTISASYCAPTGNYTTLIPGDCNDNDHNITTPVTYYADRDGDGHGSAGKDTTTLNEGFTSVSSLFTSTGWKKLNASSPVGTGIWDQGNPINFVAASGATNSYAAVGYNSTTGNSTISNWLFTPVLNLSNGAVLTFKTRTTKYPAVYADRLKVKLSMNGSSSLPVDFTFNLITINDTLSKTGYPGIWTTYTVVLSGLPLSATGRIAFHYDVPNGGPSGINGNYIGIDEVIYTEKANGIFNDCTPPPPGYVLTNDDCDDNNANVYPLAFEYCNGIDDNCDGQIENGLSTTFLGLVAHYPLDINVQDITSNAYDAYSSSNVIYPSPGVCSSPSAMSLGQANDIRIPRSVQDNFTISFWFKTAQSATTGTTTISQGISLVDADTSIAGAKDWGIALLDGGKVAFGVGGTTDLIIKSASNYNDNVWHHVAVTRKMSNGVIALYVDNVKVASGTSTYFGSLNTASFIGVGRSPLHQSNYFGKLDELQIYNTVLDTSQIRVLSSCSSNVIFYADNDGDGYGTIGQTKLQDESFDSFSSLSANGWIATNVSSPVGTGTWSQGGSNFAASSGNSNSYVGVGFSSGSGVSTLSNWLLSPVMTLKAGTVITFKTRTSSTVSYPDRLQVYLSDDSASTNVGNATSTGDFTFLLTDINPTQTKTGYPTGWTEYTLTITNTNFTIPKNGRIGFRYYVTNGGSGANSYYIGLDDFSVKIGTAPVTACVQPPNTVLNALDCDDNNALINPLMYEIACNGIDDNCNGFLDENNSLSFDGSNDLVAINTGAASLTGTFTVECWAKAAVGGLTVGLFGSRTGTDNSFDIQFNPTRIHGDIGNGTAWLTTAADVTMTYVPNTWYHIAYVVTTTGYTIYINGVLSGSGTYSGTPLLFNATHTLGIGAVSGNTVTPGGTFNGQIDDVRIWNTARTAGDIIGNMYSTLTYPQSNLIAYYKFDQGFPSASNTAFTTLTDLSGNNYHGTLANMSLTGTTSNWADGIKQTWYRDVDGDLTGTNAITVSTLCPPSGYVLRGGDCDDSNANISPDVLIYATADEGTNLTLTAPAGTYISEITFASYGTPTGSNGNFSYSNCHYAQTKRIVESYALYKTTAVIPANSATFADVCLSSSEKLYVAARCAKIELSCNSTDDNCSGVIDENNSLSFDGSNDYVALVSNPLQSATNFTVEAWVYPTAYNSWSRIIDFGTGTSNYLYFSATSSGSGIPRFVFRPTAATTEQIIDANTTIPVNTWTHLAFVLNGSVGTIYINGVASGQNNAVTWRPSNVGSTPNNWLGRSQYPADAYYAGRMDELRLWNVARTQAEIQSAMNSDDAFGKPGLLGYYKFDRGTANATGTTNAKDTAVVDISGNSNVGSLKNFALSGTTSNWTNGVTRTLYRDADGDNFGNAAVTTSSFCLPLSGYVTDNTDCNDNNAAIKPTGTLTIACAPSVSVNVAAGHCTDSIQVTAPVAGSNCTANGALIFDGSNDFVSMGSNSGLSTATDFTIEAWVYPKSNAAYQRIIDFSVNSTNYIAFATSTDPGSGLGKPVFNLSKAGTSFNIKGNTVLTLNQWSHVAVTLSGNTITLYLNGVSIGSSSTFTARPNQLGATSFNYIGKSQFASDPYFNGAIDELRVWTVARSKAQIVANMNLKLTGLEAGLVRYYDLNDLSGTSAKDNSPSNSTGTLSNFNSTVISGWSAGPTQIPNVGLYNSYTKSSSGISSYPAGTTACTWTASDHNASISCTQNVIVIPPYWYKDVDKDGYGRSTDSISACTAPLGYVSNKTDCNDSDAYVNLPLQYFIDNDHDGFGSSDVGYSCNSAPPVGFSNNNSDCDDTKLLYADNDKDGYGSGSAVACGVANNTDCNDNDFAIFPSAVETYCNGIDENCNGLIDEGNTLSASVASTINACGNAVNGLVNLSVQNGVAPYAVQADTTWASSVLNFSSQYSSSINGWSANDILGAPNVHPSYGDLPKAWAPLTTDATREFIEVGFNRVRQITNILIAETFNPGAIDSVFVKDASSDQWIQVYSGTASALPATSRMWNLPVSYSFPISAVRVALNSPAVAGWNEIDAIGIIGSVGAISGTQITNLPQGTNNIQIVAANGCKTSVSFSIATSAPTTFYADLDHDTYGDSLNTTQACTAPLNYVSNSSDCNDANASVHQKYYFYPDADMDGYGSIAPQSFCSLTPPVGFVINNTDCDDADINIHSPVLYHIDVDQDGFGSNSNDISTFLYVCSLTAPSGYVNNNNDCDDSRKSYIDADNDGFGGQTLSACGVYNNDDCNDNDGSVYQKYVLFRDYDADNFGDPLVSITSCNIVVAGYVLNNTDCNDTVNSIHSAFRFFQDNDADTYGNVNRDTLLCFNSPPANYVSNSNDCDDGNALIHFEKTYYEDADHDTYGNLYKTIKACSLTPPTVTTTQITYLGNKLIRNGAVVILNGGNLVIGSDVIHLHLDTLFLNNVPMVLFSNPLYLTNDTIYMYPDVTGTIVVTYVADSSDCDDSNILLHISHFYFSDKDADGFGSQDSLLSCSSTPPSGYVTTKTDCDDTRLLYIDADADGFGSSTLAACGAPNQDDCNDLNPAITVFYYYRDYDGDGFGSYDSVKSCSVTVPLGFASNHTDCNDSLLLYIDADHDNYGGTQTIACGIADHSDCNDLDSTFTYPLAFYVDHDADGFGNSDSVIFSCSVHSVFGYVSDSSDCNDAVLMYADIDNDGFGSTSQLIGCGLLSHNDCSDRDSLRNPGVTEKLCNSVDDNCDGQVDEGNLFNVSVTGTESAGAGTFNGVINLNPSGGSGIYRVNSIVKWSDNVIAYSSEKGTASGTGSANDILGIPDQYPNYGHTTAAWSSNSPDSTREFIETGFSTPVDIAGLLAIESFNTGAIDTMYVRNYVDHSWNAVYQDSVRPDTNAVIKPIILSYRDTLTYLVDAVRISMNSSAIQGYNEVDAVGAVINDGTLSGNSIIGLPPGQYSLTMMDTVSKCLSNFDAIIGTQILQARLWFADRDADGYGNPKISISSAIVPAGYVANNYDCIDSLANSNPAAVEICGDGIDNNCNGFIDEGCTLTPVTFNLKVFIQGLYIGAGRMTPAMYNSGVSFNKLMADSVTIELHDALSPSRILYSSSTVLTIEGFATVYYPVAVVNNSYYIVIRHRNGIETWSKDPVAFSASQIFFDFTH